MFTVSLFFPVRIRRNNPRSKKTLELIEGAMAGINERLNKRGYYVSCQSGEEKICFLFIFLFLTFVGREAGLLFYILI